MLIQEIVTINNKNFKHSYSSNNKYIKQDETGALYKDAYDVLIRDFHYTETDKEIVDDEDDNVPQK